jgi:dipeptidyl aminopeptidase/acylaminoacyl peptidase
VAHIDQADPPLLLIHGTADPQMPPEQSDELAKAYRAQHWEVTLVPMINSKHGGSEFYDDDRTKTAATFLKRHLLQ